MRTNANKDNGNDSTQNTGEWVREDRKRKAEDRIDPTKELHPLMTQSVSELTLKLRGEREEQTLLGHVRQEERGAHNHY